MELYSASKCCIFVTSQHVTMYVDDRLIQRVQPGLIKKINRSKKPFGGRVSCINITCYHTLIIGEPFLLSGCM